MGSTFNKRYELIRDQFYKTTNEFPQLKVNAAGKAKSSGIGEDTKMLDTLLDADELDVAKLTKTFQDFTKHARSYAEQISFTPGKGIYDWMEVKSGKPADPTKAKLVKDASSVLQNHIEVLIKDVDATVSSGLTRGNSRDQSKAVLTAIQNDVEGWDKYLDLKGITLVADKRFTLLLDNPRTSKPPTDVLNANTAVIKAQATFGKLVATAGKVDVSGRKGAADMEKVMKGMMDTVQDLKNNLLQWNNEYKNVLTEWDRSLKATPNPQDQQKVDKARNVLSAAMTTVDAAKQKIGTNLELKIIATRKTLSSI